MSKITCMIIEDEPVAQELMRRYIADVPHLELISVCSNAIEAGEELRQSKVDLLFLDINMPKLSGADFYASLVNPPAVIFTTAYPEYAVSGFELNAIDYLVKPFPFDRFERAVNKFIEQRKVPTHIMLQADKKMYRVDFADIETIEAMGDYVKVKTNDQVLIVHQTLQRLLDQLPGDLFRRIHKSFVISVTKLQYVEGNTALVAGQKIPIGQTYRASFLATL